MLRSLTVVCTLAIVAALTANASAIRQTSTPKGAGPPNFTGTWERDAKRSENPFSKDAERIHLEQSATEITMTTGSSPGRMDRYAIGGAVSSNASTSASSLSTASWRGSALVLTSSVTPTNGESYIRIISLRLSPDGKELTTETSAQDADGKPVNFKQVWLKVSDR